MFDFISSDLIYKFLKFCAVGFSGMILDFGITYICKEKIKIQKFVSNAIGFSFAATSNYFLNRLWTFYSQNPKMLIEFGQFFAISTIGLFINTIALYLFVNKFKTKFYLSKLFAIGVTTIWNFFANYLYTFA